MIEKSGKMKGEVTNLQAELENNLNTAKPDLPYTWKEMIGWRGT